MTKREQLKHNLKQYLQKEIAYVDTLDDQELTRYFDTRIWNCSPCVFDGRECYERCKVRIYNYLKEHGDEEVDNDKS